MNKKDLSERDICSKFISPAVKRAGWDGMMQIREEVAFTNGSLYELLSRRLIQTRAFFSSPSIRKIQKRHETTIPTHRCFRNTCSFFLRGCP
jgi:hypothetical protein